MAGQQQESSSFQEKPLNRPEKANGVLIILFNCEGKGERKDNEIIRCIR